MIKWREGKAGFVGASKRLIKGFFDYSYTLTSEAAVTPGLSFGVLSRIDENGQGVTGLIMENGQGVEGEITDNGKGVVGLMNAAGSGVEGDM